MFASVRSNPAKFDMIHMARDWFKPFVEADLLAEFDPSRTENISNILPGFDWKAGTSVDGKLYGTLYNWGDQPLGWNADAIKKYDVAKYSGPDGKLNDWNVFWDPQFRGKVAIFDDPTSVQPMVALSLGFRDPYNLDEGQLDALAKRLNELRPQVKRLTSGGASDQISAFVSGEAEIGYINIPQVVVDSNAQGVPLEVNHAVKQGTPAWSDNASLTKAGAEKADAVYKFIEATMDVPWQARFEAETGNSGILSYDEATSPAARTAGLDKKKLNYTLIPQAQEGAKFFDSLVFYETVEDIQRRLEIWNEFKLGIGS
jgi:spermidine/putrescine-binding protein